MNIIECTLYFVATFNPLREIEEGDIEKIISKGNEFVWTTNTGNIVLVGFIFISIVINFKLLSTTLHKKCINIVYFVIVYVFIGKLPK